MTIDLKIKIAKIALIIPLLTGLLILIEQVLPLKTCTTTVEHKRENYRAKYNQTTYSINFRNLNDQFTETIYNTLEKGDSVMLKTSFFTREVRWIKKLGSPTLLKNDTSEVYFHIGLAIAMLGFSIFFLKKRFFTTRNFIYIGVLTIIGCSNLYRILILNL